MDVAGDLIGAAPLTMRGEKTLGSRTMSLPIRQCARRERYQIIPASAESLKSVFYPFLSCG